MLTILTHVHLRAEEQGTTIGTAFDGGLLLLQPRGLLGLGLPLDQDQGDGRDHDQVEQ